MKTKIYKISLRIQTEAQAKNFEKFLKHFFQIWYVGSLIESNTFKEKTIKFKEDLVKAKNKFKEDLVKAKNKFKEDLVKARSFCSACKKEYALVKFCCKCKSKNIEADAKGDYYCRDCAHTTYE